MKLTDEQWRLIEKLRNANSKMGLRPFAELVYRELNIKITHVAISKRLKTGVISKQHKEKRKGKKKHKILNKAIRSKVEIISDKKIKVNDNLEIICPYTIREDGKRIYNKELLFNSIVKLKDMGYTTKKIAETLDVKVRTVEHYLYNKRDFLDGSTHAEFEKKVIKQIETTKRQEIQNTLDTLLADILQRAKMRMNVLKTLDYNLTMRIKPEQGQQVKTLDKNEQKEISSFVYALNTTSKFLFDELEAFFKITSLADMKELYQDIQDNKNGELDEILTKLLDNKEKN